jgi:Histone deacetylase domain
VFNSVAAGALHALDEDGHGVQRVAIIDLDIHHGSGTEDIVRRYPHPSRLFFFCLHLFDEEFSATLNSPTESVVPEQSPPSSTAVTQLGSKIPDPVEGRDAAAVQTSKAGTVPNQRILFILSSLPSSTSCTTFYSYVKKSYHFILSSYDIFSPSSLRNSNLHLFSVSISFIRTSHFAQCPTPIAFNFCSSLIPHTKTPILFYTQNILSFPVRGRRMTRSTISSMFLCALYGSK